MVVLSFGPDFSFLDCWNVPFLIFELVMTIWSDKKTPVLDTMLFRGPDADKPLNTRNAPRVTMNLMTVSAVRSPLLREL